MLYRLYLTAYWLLLAPAVGVPLVVYAVQLHDEPIVTKALACYDDPKAMENARAAGAPERGAYLVDRASNTARVPLADVNSRIAEGWRAATVAEANALDIALLEEHCGVDIIGSHAFATNAWEFRSRDSLENRNAIFASSLAAAIPLAVLVLARRWLRWLLGAKDAPLAK